MGDKKYCCGHRTRRDSEESFSSDAEPDIKQQWPLWKKIAVWSTVALFVLLFIVFIIIWVVVPIVFWLSIGFQRSMIFMPFDSPKNPDFNDPGRYGISGVYNFYISVTDVEDPALVTTIGAWLVVPEKDKGSITSGDIPRIIAETEFDIVIYLHGVAENRAKAVSKYEVLRKYFLIISIDHRGYGDSGPDVAQSEQGIINDNMQVYNWIMAHDFKNNIYYWGHSLGAALSCHTVRALKEQKGVVPRGLVMESAFTTLEDEIVNNLIGKIFKWLAYFNSTVLHPLDVNGFHFHSTTNILSVDCPIMLLHAEDDEVIPYFLGTELAEVAQTERNPRKQGPASFYSFPAERGYGHNFITTDPTIPGLIENFKSVCEAYWGPP